MKDPQYYYNSSWDGNPCKVHLDTSLQTKNVNLMEEETEELWMFHLMVIHSTAVEIRQSGSKKGADRPINIAFPWAMLRLKTQKNTKMFTENICDINMSSRDQTVTFTKPDCTGHKDETWERKSITIKFILVWKHYLAFNRPFSSLISVVFPLTDLTDIVLTGCFFFIYLLWYL